MGEKGPSSWRRAFNRYIGLITAIIGLTIVVTSFFFVGNLSMWYLTVMAGLLLAMGGFLYGAHPFLTSERRYSALRREVDRFIGLVRQLNAAASRSDAMEEFERVKDEMMRSVERMSDLAGKPDTKTVVGEQQTTVGEGTS